jgi:hypothetical protein
MDHAMISLVLPVTREEPALLDTLSAFVPGVAEGVIRDAVLVSAITSTTIDCIADAAGCAVLADAGPRPALVRTGALRARSDWVLVIEPGLVPTGPWMTEMLDFVATASGHEAAAFRLAMRGGIPAQLSAFVVNAGTSLGRTDPRQGLLARREAVTAGARLKTRLLPCAMYDRRGTRPAE